MILEQLADRVSAAIWNLHPGWAVATGRHEYDGQVPDLSAGAIAAGLERLGRLREQLADLVGLTPEQEVDRAVLLGVIARERFEGETSRRWRRDPGWYLEPLDVSVYLERDYAPAGLRLERAAAVLGETGRLLETARENLETVLPRAWVGMAMVASGGPGRSQLREWMAITPPAPAEAGWLREVAGDASRELGSFSGWLEEERFNRSCGVPALRPEWWEGWLRASEGLALSAGEAAARGVARLEEDRRALEADLATLAPGLTVEEACARIAAEGAEADPVVAGRRAVEEALQGIGPLGPVPCKDLPAVQIGPRPASRAWDGWLQAPGPYDDPATKPILYIVPGWGRAALDALAVTEVCPGRLVALRHAAGAPGEARRRFPSRGFLDGWSLYAGDLMAEAGFREAAPGWRLLWRRRVVVADCRLAYAPRLHSGEIPFERVEQAFEQEAGLSALAAGAEAGRLAADPGLVLGALGRIEILEARRRWGGERSLGAFHEALLRAAALPLGLLDRLLP
jgi:hypothetical protein